MPKLIVLRGLPASGKTTWAKEWVAASADRGRVNRDDLRAALFVKPTYAHDQEEIVTAVERDATRHLLAAGRDVVVDATNLRPQYVRSWRRFALAHGAEFTAREFPIDVDEAIRRDINRATASVGEDVIRRMAGKYMPRGEFLPIPDEDEPVTEPPEAYVPKPGATPAIVVDVDGTLALNTGRDIYDLTRVHEDAVNQPVAEFVRHIDDLDHRQVIIICSGREESCRALTEQWLASNQIPWDVLLMRPTGDRRKDAIVKAELFGQHIRDNYNVRFVLDDRNQVVDMWRSLGLACFQVAPGDF